MYFYEPLASCRGGARTGKSVRVTCSLLLTLRTLGWNEQVLYDFMKFEGINDFCTIYFYQILWSS